MQEFLLKYNVELSLRQWKQGCWKMIVQVEVRID